MVTKVFGFRLDWMAGAVMCAAIAVGYAQSSSSGSSTQKKKPATTSSKSPATHHATTAHHAAGHGAATKRTSAKKGAGRGKVRRKHIESAPTALSRRLH